MKKINKEQAQEIAAEMIEEYLTAEAGKRLVSDNENPLKAYIQEQNAWSQAGEVFSVKCPGIGNHNMSDYREGWECSHLSDEEVLSDCCENGDMNDDIDHLAELIYESASEED